MHSRQIIITQNVEYNDSLISDQIKVILGKKLKEIFETDSAKEHNADIIPENIKTLIDQRRKVLDEKEESNNEESYKIRSEIDLLTIDDAGKYLNLDSIEKHEGSRTILVDQTNQIKNILLLIGQDDKEIRGSKYDSGIIKNAQDLLNALQIKNEDEITPNFIIKNYTKCINIINNILKFKGVQPLQILLNAKILPIRRILPHNITFHSIDEKILCDFNKENNLKLNIDQYLTVLNLYNKYKKQNNKQLSDLREKKEECNFFESIEYLFFNSVREYMFFKKSSMEEIVNSILNNQKTDNSNMHKEFLIEKYNTKEGLAWINRIIEREMERLIADDKTNFDTYVSQYNYVIVEYKDFIKDESLKNALSTIIQKIEQEWITNLHRLKKNNQILLKQINEKNNQEKLKNHQRGHELKSMIDQNAIKQGEKYIKILAVLNDALKNSSDEETVIIKSLIDSTNSYDLLVEYILNTNCLLSDDLKETIGEIINSGRYTINSQEPVNSKKENITQF